jgi:hypothetical protein
MRINSASISELNAPQLAAGFFTELLDPEWVALTTREEVLQHRHLIRHLADVPILVAALKAQPDWFITENTRHFTQQVARRTGLRIVHPWEFIQMVRLNH